jgi:hypothetical protein
VVQEDEDPFKTLFDAEAAELRRRQEAHERERSTPEYKAEITRIRETVHAFANTMRLCVIASTRSQLASESFFLRHVDELSTAAVLSAAAFNEGAINAGRRELRFLLELAMKAAYVDEAINSSPFETRLEFFARKVKRHSADYVRDLQLAMLGPERDAFTKAVVNAWSEASNYVHPTTRQIRETLELRAAGSSPGFGSRAELARAADALLDATTYAVVVAFHVIGPPLTGDMLVDALDKHDRWPFHASRFVAAIDASFDYKAERQERLDEIRNRRGLRVRR